MNCPDHYDQYNGLTVDAYQIDTLVRSAMKQIADLDDVGSQELFDIDTLMQIASERLTSLAETAAAYSHTAYKRENPGDKATSIDGKGGAS